MTGVPPHDPFGQPMQPPQQPPPTYQTYPSYSPQAPRPGDDGGRSRTQAVWALVLAIVPLCLSQIAAAILAIIVLVGPRDGQRRGRGMAWSALVIVALWVVAALIGVIVAIAYGLGSISVDRDENGQVTERGDLFPEDLRVGDCLDEDVSAPSETGWTETVVPCDDLHSGQIYLEVPLEGDDYPALATIRELGDTRCAEGFAEWVGAPLKSSELTVSYLYPDEENWDFDGTIKCIAVPPEKVTGTLEASGR